MPIFREADGVFEFSPNGQNRRQLFFEKNGDGNKAAGTAHLSWYSSDDAHYGIVAAQQNVAIVDEEVVGQPAQARHRFVVIDGNRLFAQIAASHDQRLKSALGKEQVVNG